jgi:hypothetical protein
VSNDNTTTEPLRIVPALSDPYSIYLLVFSIFLICFHLLLCCCGICGRCIVGELRFPQQAMRRFLFHQRFHHQRGRRHQHIRYARRRRYARGRTVPVKAMEEIELADLVVPGANISEWASLYTTIPQSKHRGEQTPSPLLPPLPSDRGNDANLVE